MQREKVIELAEQAGFKYPKEITENPEWSTYADRMHSRLQEFARLVEKETLERAARLAKSYHQHGYDVTGNLELHEAILHKDFQDF